MPAGGQHTHMRGFSAEEDAHLASLMETMGPKWKTIAEAMSAAVPDAPPRTAAMVRNRFLRVQKGKREAEEGKARNKCGRCGALKKGHVCTVGKALALTPTMSEDLKTNTPHTVHESNDLHGAMPRYRDMLARGHEGTPSLGALVVVTEETDAFRKLCRLQAQQDDTVVELGCSYG